MDPAWIAKHDRGAIGKKLTDVRGQVAGMGIADGRGRIGPCETGSDQVGGKGGGVVRGDRRDAGRRGEGWRSRLGTADDRDQGDEE